MQNQQIGTSTSMKTVRASDIRSLHLHRHRLAWESTGPIWLRFETRNGNKRRSLFSFLIPKWKLARISFLLETFQKSFGRFYSDRAYSLIAKLPFSVAL